MLGQKSSFLALLEFLVKFDAKNGFFDSFPLKNVYNYVLCLNGSNVTALNVFQILNVITCLKPSISRFRVMLKWDGGSENKWYNSTYKCNVM